MTLKTVEVTYPNGSTEKFTEDVYARSWSRGYVPSKSEHIVYGFPGDVGDWVRHGRPMRKNAFGNWSPATGRTCSSVEEHKLDNNPEILAEWFAMVPGCRGNYDATAGLGYSESIGAFVGYIAPEVERPADEAAIVPVPKIVESIATAPEIPPFQPTSVQPEKFVSPAIDPEAGEFVNVSRGKRAVIDAQKTAMKAPSDFLTGIDPKRIILGGDIFKYLLWGGVAILILISIAGETK